MPNEVANLQNQIQALQARVESDSKAYNAAEALHLETKKSSAVRMELAKQNFVSPDAHDIVLSLIGPKVQQDEAGQLMAEGLPVPAFVTRFLTDHPFYLSPPPRSGGGSNYPTPHNSFDIDQIRPGMSKETEIAAVKAIRRALESK